MSGMTDHLGADLSAFLDEALAPAERARVQEHLDACGACRARLAELRATASLIAALPSPAPRRSLVPAVVERLNWLRPLRSLSLVASGAFLFFFVAAAVLETGSDLGAGPSAPFGAPAAAPAAAGATQTVERTVDAPAGPAATGELAGRDAEAEEDAAEADAAEEDAMNFQAEEAYGVERGFGVFSFLWLTLAVIAATIALLAHRRLRAT